MAGRSADRSRPRRPVSPPDPGEDRTVAPDAPDLLLDQDLNDLGIVTVEALGATQHGAYLLTHQTNVEFFAALFFVESLLAIELEKRADYLIDHWAEAIYNIDLRVVWQFVSGLVIEREILLLYGNGATLFEVFAQFLCDVPEDLVGKVYRDVLNECVSHFHKNLLSENASGERLLQKQEAMRKRKYRGKTNDYDSIGLLVHEDVMPMPSDDIYDIQPFALSVANLNDFFVKLTKDI